MYILVIKCNSILCNGYVGILIRFKIWVSICVFDNLNIVKNKIKGKWWDFLSIGILERFFGLGWSWYCAIERIKLEENV